MWTGCLFDTCFCSISTVTFQLSDFAFYRLIKCHTIILDEISMVSSHVLLTISKLVSYLRHAVDRPFGGVQRIFCGDFHQLPPVPNVPNGEPIYLLTNFKVFVPHKIHLQQVVVINLERNS